jgi:hypothetical protein
LIWQWNDDLASGVMDETPLLSARQGALTKDPSSAFGRCRDMDKQALSACDAEMAISTAQSGWTGRFRKMPCECALAFNYQAVPSPAHLGWILARESKCK